MLMYILLLQEDNRLHDVFWCVLCMWAKLPEIKLDDDDDYPEHSLLA